MCRRHRHSYIHITGTDIPAFPYHFLPKDLQDLVLGPAKDGGVYYLATLGRNGDLFAQRELYDSPPDQVFNTLLRLCEKKHLKYEVLKEWVDIDTDVDLRTCLNSLGKSVLPFTFMAQRKYIGPKWKGHPAQL